MTVWSFEERAAAAHRMAADPHHAMGYIGRFAPSPTGPLHAGSLVAALASWLDTRAHHGRWLVRIEDLDTPRCVPGADRHILGQLAALGLRPDAPTLWQSQRQSLYGDALERLRSLGCVYPCACSRQAIAAALAQEQTNTPQATDPPLLDEMVRTHGTLVYPGTCRPERGGLRGRPPRSMRLRLPQGGASHVAWTDRRLGPQQQAVDQEVGDFVLRRADGLWAYQLAVVVDDAAQGVSDVVRGADLADNTARQILLQRALQLPTPRYLHTPLVRGDDGAKLSKQHGAPPLDATRPFEALRAAAQMLEIDVPAAPHIESWFNAAVAAWAARWVASSELQL